MRQRRVDREVVALAVRIERRQQWVVDHELSALGERAIALVAADTALGGRPWAWAVDDVIAGIAQLGRQLVRESDVAVCDEDAAHGCLLEHQCLRGSALPPRPAGWSGPTPWGRRSSGGPL